MGEENDLFGGDRIELAHKNHVGWRLGIGRGKISNHFQHFCFLLGLILASLRFYDLRSPAILLRHPIVLQTPSLRKSQSLLAHLDLWSYKGYFWHTDDQEIAIEEDLTSTCVRVVLHLNAQDVSDCKKWVKAIQYIVFGHGFNTCAYTLRFDEGKYTSVANSGSGDCSGIWSASCGGSGNGSSSTKVCLTRTFCKGRLLSSTNAVLIACSSSKPSFTCRQDAKLQHETSIKAFGKTERTT